jgi:hypothetical protein
MVLKLVETSPAAPASEPVVRDSLLVRIRFQLLKWFFTAFPMPLVPDPPLDPLAPTTPRAKAPALREGALLREDLDAVATKKIA